MGKTIKAQEAAIIYATSPVSLNNIKDAYGFSSVEQVKKQVIKENGALVKEFAKGLKPLFKWTGGKRKEIKFFEPLFPNFVKDNSVYTFVEPFVGGGAVYFYLNNFTGHNVINDFDKQVVNFYKQVKNPTTRFLNDLKDIQLIKEHDLLEKTYYEQRNKDRDNGLSKLTDEELAVRFFVVNQLAFSGMRRFNSNGEFNVPFGHYKRLNASIISSQEHKRLLDNTKITCGDFEKIMVDNDKKNTFIFLDPPYTRVFKKYSYDNTFGESEHERLAKTFKKIENAKVMLVIDKSDLTNKLYKDHIKQTYDLKYGVNIKNRFDQSVQHLVICNYD